MSELRPHMLIKRYILRMLSGEAGPLATLVHVVLMKMLCLHLPVPTKLVALHPDAADAVL